MNLGTSFPRPGADRPGPRVTRRHAIQAGAIGLLGLGSNHLAALKALAAPEAKRAEPQAKSVIAI